MNTVVLGNFQGDEAKGRFVDYLTPRYDVVARCGAGANAGHTIVVNGKKTILRLCPSGVLHPNKKIVLGQGMAINLEVLYNEVNSLPDNIKKNVSVNLYVSDKAHVVLPYHKLIDEARENSSGNRIGTTKNGIGPLFEEKMRRTSIRLGDLYSDKAESLIEQSLNGWAPYAKEYNTTLPTAKEVLDELSTYLGYFDVNVCATSWIINNTFKHSNILFEGAQGALLDVDNGSYPFVTSSNCTIGGILTGAGVSHKKINNVIGVIKGYGTKVGAGPLPTIIDGSISDYIVEKGQEFGSVTGRKRKVAWLDLPALKYANTINGVDELAIAKLDVLTGLEEVNVCTDYLSDGFNVGDHFWYSSDYSREVTPVYKTFKGWDKDITSCRSFNSLPIELMKYLEFIEEQVRTPIKYISVGRDREEIIERIR